MSAYGYGISYSYGLTRRWSFTSGPRLVAETVARIWRTTVGSVPWAPEIGGDLDDMLSATTDELPLLPARLEAAALQDERVASCEVTTSYDGEVLVIEGALVLDGGETFTLVARADEAAVQILEGRA